ncbi:uncharacterized protein BDZ99DRAFT_483703 [Mytilinidion resinicola]|uniref:RING-type domain-containing protein n=1 Tax=Mytilinidion resinicola TaxID=574789 RepID=A0A6A6XYV6_9PEZI|nr:uncharacterized protein BDZ99DRAFT_483703 [Mytilinidion resinicola]KAF2801468.1 hypothetical protein BDZ99DRAFT_483703 [Mytilinidion resinicola]
MEGHGREASASIGDNVEQVSPAVSENTAHIIVTDVHGTATIHLPRDKTQKVNFHHHGVIKSTIAIERDTARPELVLVYIQEGVAPRIWFGEPVLTPTMKVLFPLCQTYIMNRFDKMKATAEDFTQYMRSKFESSWVGSHEIFHHTGYQLVHTKGKPTIVLQHGGRTVIVIAGLGDALAVTKVPNGHQEPTRRTQDMEMFEEVSECSICLDPYDTDHLAVRLPCGHYFGKDCILGVIQHSSNTQAPRCPNYRATIQGA